MIDELWKSIKATLYDRASSPLLGAFAVSWFVWNYRMVVVVFADLEPTAKFDLINHALYPTAAMWIGFVLLSPMLTALSSSICTRFPPKGLRALAQETEGAPGHTAENRR